MAARGWFVVVVAATIFQASLSGCATTPKSELYEKVGHGDLTLGALRVIVRDCARRFPAVLEAEATALRESPQTTPAQRRGLIEFKANGVPMIQGVLLQQDPVAALLDGWALLYQLRDFLVRSTVQSPRLPETVRTVEGLADELAGVWAQLTGRADVAPTRARVEAWARAHPLQGSLLARDSTAPLLASLLGRERVSMAGAAGTAIETMQDAMARLDLLAITLPRQARWQAEAAVADLATSPEADRLAAAMDRVIALVEPLSELASDTSEMITRERGAAMADIDRERQALQAFVRDERRALMADVAAERDAALQQADGLAHGIVDRVFERLQRLLLLSVAVLAIVVAAAFVAWLLLSRGRRRPVLRMRPGVSEG